MLDLSISFNNIRLDKTVVFLLKKDKKFKKNREEGKGEESAGLMATVLDWRFKVSEFELQLRHDVHSQTNTSMN